MDNVKIGALIAAVRKERGLTQKELGRRLHVSDRAVSKWERGLNLPDAALFEPLCRELDISVTELLRGERQEATVPQLEQVVSDTVALAGRKERTIKWLKRLAIVLLCVLGVIGKLWWDYTAEQREQQLYYDREDMFPSVALGYNGVQSRVEEMVLYVEGMYGPFRGEHESEKMFYNHLGIRKELDSVPPMQILDASDQLHQPYVLFYLSNLKNDMDIRILRWPSELRGTEVGVEDAEEVAFTLDETIGDLKYNAAYNGPRGKFYVEPGYVYSVFLSWGDGYYAEYPFLTI